MIGRLSGRLVEEQADGSLLIEVGGVGYEVIVPLGTRGRLGAGLDGDVVVVFVHTHAREDALILYGFATREDRAVFRTLIGISNVGPKLALAVLGALTGGELASAIVRGELGRLVSIPGIGKKTAERLVLELKDKLMLASAPATAATSSATAPPEGKGALLHGALTRMGYRPSEAERALTTLGPARIEAAPLDDLVREALAALST